MRRLLLVVTAILLIGGALAGGTLAADWPFWQRAFAWQRAPDGLPVTLPGSRLQIGDGTSRPLPAGQVPPDVDTASVAGLARATGATALLVGQEGRVVLALFGNQDDAARPLEGGGLAPLLLLPVYAGLATEGHVDLLDRPLGRVLEEWSGGDPRGQITPRQLFRHLGGLAVPPFRPMNPFSDRARLASGPNFARAALGFPAAWPPGTHVGASPADAQLLALVAERASGRRYAALLEEYVFRPLGAGSAAGLLDHPRGGLAAHCCIAAVAADWLRVAMLFAVGAPGAGASRADAGFPGLPARFAAELLRSSSVAPDRGLGFTIGTTQDGRPLLEATSPGRLLVADPGRRRTLVWFGRRALAPAEQAALLRAAGW